MPVPPAFASPIKVPDSGDEQIIEGTYDSPPPSKEASQDFPSLLTLSKTSPIANHSPPLHVGGTAGDAPRVGSARDARGDSRGERADAESFPSLCIATPSVKRRHSDIFDGCSFDWVLGPQSLGSRESLLPDSTDINLALEQLDSSFEDSAFDPDELIAVLGGGLQGLGAAGGLIGEGGLGAAASAAAAAAAVATAADVASAAADAVAETPGEKVVIVRREWTAEEDKVIREGVLQFGKKWRRISLQLEERSDDAVRNRWSRIEASAQRERDGGGEAPDLNSPEAALPLSALAAATEHQPKRRRSPPSSAEVDPNTKRWTREQDAVILSSVREMGHNWGFIAGIMPGRSELSIRNRWQRLHSKQLEQGMAPVMVGS